MLRFYKMPLIPWIDQGVTGCPDCFEMWAICCEERIKVRRVCVEEVLSICIAPVLWCWPVWVLILTCCHLCGHAGVCCLLVLLPVVHDG